MRRRSAETPGEGGLFQAAFTVLAWTVLAIGFTPRLEEGKLSRMARKASSKLESTPGWHGKRLRLHDTGQAIRRAENQEKARLQSSKRWPFLAKEDCIPSQAFCLMQKAPSIDSESDDRGRA